MTDFISLYRASKIFIQGTFCQWNLRTTNEASQCVMGPIRMPSLFPFCNGWGPQSWNVQELCNLKFPWMVHVVENVHFAIKRYFKYEKLRILWFLGPLNYEMSNADWFHLNVTFLLSILLKGNKNITVSLMIKVEFFFIF